MSEFLADWLRIISHRGGKGVVDNIDARALGRCADELDLLATQVGLLRKHMKTLREIVNSAVAKEIDAALEATERPEAETIH